MKKSIKYVAISTVILALIVVTIFGISADAAGGVKTVYGRRLQEQSPESLDSSYAGWSWIDTGSDDYFGNVGQQAFVITKGSKYKSITVDVEPKQITPIVEIGSSASTIPSLWAGNSNKAKISSYQHTVTVTAGTGGSVSGSGTYTQGDTYTIKATASSGYKFVRWSDGNTSASRTLTMGNSNVSYIATFESAIVAVTAYGSYVETNYTTNVNSANFASSKTKVMTFADLASGYNPDRWSTWNGGTFTSENAKYLVYIYTGNNNNTSTPKTGVKTKPTFSPNSLTGIASGWTCLGRFSGSESYANDCDAQYFYKATQSYTRAAGNLNHYDYTDKWAALVQIN